MAITFINQNTFFVSVPAATNENHPCSSMLKSSLLHIFEYV